MTTLEQVLRKAQTLKEALEKVQSNHFYWLRKTRPLLEATLREIQNQTDLNWSAQELTAELVSLILRDEAGQQTAALSYRLTDKSRVSIDVSYHTKSYQPDTRSEITQNLYTLEPGLVDEDLIHASVTQFIDILLKEHTSLPTTYKDLRATPNTIHIRTRKPNI